MKVFYYYLVVHFINDITGDEVCVIRRYINRSSLNKYYNSLLHNSFYRILYSEEYCSSRILFVGSELILCNKKRYSKEYLPDECL